MKIKELSVSNPGYTIKEMCDVFELNQSTYFDRTKVKPHIEEKKKINSILKQKAIETNHSYGKRRMRKQFKLEGINFGIYKTTSMMKFANLVAIKFKKKHYYPNGSLYDIKIQNILNRKFKQPKAGAHWVGDITYIRIHQD